MGVAVHVQHAQGLRRHHERKADRERDVLGIGGAELRRRRPLDQQRLAPLEGLPRDRRSDRYPRSLEPVPAGRADGERVAGGIDRHERCGVEAHGLVSGFDDKLEELFGTRGPPDAHRRALERSEECGGGQVAGCSTRPFRTA